jgi:hypothetical protein
MLCAAPLAYYHRLLPTTDACPAEAISVKAAQGSKLSIRQGDPFRQRRASTPTATWIVTDEAINCEKQPVVIPAGEIRNSHRRRGA